MRFGQVRALFIKETLALWRDTKSRTVLIIPPLFQLVVFSFAATLEIKNVAIGVLNQDNGRYSYELIQRFVGAPHFNSIVFAENREQLKTLMDNQRVLMAMSFLPTFSRNILRGQTADLQLVLDGRSSNASQIVLGYTNSIVARFQEDILKADGRPGKDVITVNRTWYNPNLDFLWFTVPNLVGILSMLVALMVTALSVARERELGTFDQLLVSPLTQTEVLLGKALPAVAIGAGEGTIMVLAAIFLFHIPFEGSFFLLYFALIVFILSVVGVGLFISSLCKTQQQAILGVFIFMVPSVSLSGFASPVENMPQWLQTATLINPLRHFITIVKGVFLKAMPLNVVWNSTWPLLIIGLCTLSLAAWFFRRRFE